MGPIRAPSAKWPAQALAVQRPRPAAGPARGHAAPATGGGGGGPGADARAFGGGGATRKAARPDFTGSRRWPGGFGLTGGAACAGSAGKRGLAALSAGAPLSAGPPCLIHGRPWRAARRGAGQAPQARLPVPFAPFPDQEPPRRASLGRFALGQAGTRNAGALHGAWGHYPGAAWRRATQRGGSGRDWRFGPLGSVAFAPQ